ncbi:MAG: putative toxin-antitoxin system toxin component, PIN family [Kiritimatiellae bacterium]|nr:putative toxin-antitoxin system toxin component, PIN family [Kiritimatiellia bacterium]
MRVFLDTNVLAAGFATRGLCSDLIREVLENHELTTSLEILVELKRILTKKFKVPAEQVEEVLDLVHTSAMIAEPDTQATYKITDMDDILHLSAAEVAQCEFFVTGDKELWSVSPIGTMRVLSPRDFWKAIQAQPNTAR